MLPADCNNLSGKWGTDSGTFFQILNTRSNHQLRQVFQAYQQRYGHNFEKVIKKEFSGHTENALVALGTKSNYGF